MTKIAMLQLLSIAGDELVIKQEKDITHSCTWDKCILKN